MGISPGSGISRGLLGDIPKTSRGLTSGCNHKMWGFAGDMVSQNHKMWGLRFYNIFFLGGLISRGGKSAFEISATPFDHSRRVAYDQGTQSFGRILCSVNLECLSYWFFW